jgi:hypothetical protein
MIRNRWEEEMLEREVYGRGDLAFKGEESSFNFKHVTIYHLAHLFNIAR